MLLRGSWPARRAFPILATTVLVLVTMASSTWWGPHLVGKPGWQVPDDLWGTLVAARRLLHLDVSGLYTQPTGLVAFPGAALILVPAAALIEAAGLGFSSPGPHNSHPAAWLAAGPYEVAISGLVLFAVDAIAERMGVSRPKRAVLAAASAVALWSVSARWGHPEDAVAVGLLLYATTTLSQDNGAGSAWLLGAAIAVQPLVLLATPILLVMVEPRRLAGYLARAAAPSAVLLGAAVAANPRATLNATIDQPNWPGVDHPTPLVSFAPHMSNGAVAAGPGRAVAILLGCACAVVVERRWRAQRRGLQWSTQALEEILWWVALTLALRCIFESVMVSYYVWPALAVAIITAARGWRRLLATSVVVSAMTFVSQASWHGRWTFWSVMAGGILLALLCAQPMFVLSSSHTGVSHRGNSRNSRYVLKAATRRGYAKARSR